MRSGQHAILITVLLLGAPSALAGWGAKGSHEPDTLLDVQSGWMTLEPDGERETPFAIYFNGFLGTSAGSSLAVNPNLATLNSSVRGPAPAPMALLGIWKDCNLDGFVGLGDNGALEYRSSLLLDRSVCPVGTPTPDRPWATNNDGEWVVEFMPIGYDDVRTSVNEDRLNLDLNQTRVWADWGLPDAPPPLSCPLLPTPYGTTRSTGGFLRWVDCFDAYRGVQTVNMAADALDRPDLSFSDAPGDRPDQSSSTLNRDNPWGDESDGAFVRTFDCSRHQDVVVSDPSGRLGMLEDENGSIVAFRLFPVIVEPQDGGSIGGQVNETEAGATDCDRNDPDEIVDLNGQRASSDGGLPYGLEDGQEATSPLARRTRTDHAFVFEEGERGNDLAGLFLGQRTREHAGSGAASINGLWVAHDSTRLSADPYLSRSDLGAAPVTHITFYAFVDETSIKTLVLRTPSGNDYAAYGEGGCLAGTFECDPELWWRDAIGRDVTPRDARLGGATDPVDPDPSGLVPIGVRIGALYNFRDTDCFDASADNAREAGAQWGALTATACVRP